jgi:hypothetical protein
VQAGRPTNLTAFPRTWCRLAIIVCLTQLARCRDWHSIAAPVICRQFLQARAKYTSLCLPPVYRHYALPVQRNMRTALTTRSLAGHTSVLHCSLDLRTLICHLLDNMGKAFIPLAVYLFGITVSVASAQISPRRLLSVALKLRDMTNSVSKKAARNAMAIECSHPEKLSSNHIAQIQEPRLFDSTGI